MGIALALGLLLLIIALDLYLALKLRKSLTFRILFMFTLAVMVAVAAGLYGEHLLPFLNEVFFPPREIFIRLLKMIIVPLVVASIIHGVTSVGGGRRLGKLGVVTAAYYLTTTGIAVFLGLVLVNLIHPGRAGMEVAAAELPEIVRQGPRPISEILLSMIPTNPAEALARMDVLALIFFSLLLAIGIIAVGRPADTLRQFFTGLNEVMMKVVSWVMEVAPVGVFALIITLVAKSGLRPLFDLPLYMATVILGLIIHGAIVLPLILRLITGRSPLEFARAMTTAILTAFSTSSSAATLPFTMEGARDRAKVRAEAVEFVCPVGATVNMDGTALYEAVAVLFIAQLTGVNLTFDQQVVVFITATLAAIGAAAVPSAGLVTMTIVLSAVGLPFEGIGIILGVDRILDMSRTTVNIWGDAVGAAVVEKLALGEGEEIKTPQPAVE